jgi:hypothetical protein
MSLAGVVADERSVEIEADDVGEIHQRMVEEQFLGRRPRAKARVKRGHARVSALPGVDR